MQGVFPCVWLSSRGIWVLLGALTLLAVSCVVPQITGLVFVAALAFLAAIFVEVRSAPTKETLLVSREPAGRLTIGRSAQIAYAVENRGRGSVRVALVETPLPTIAFEREMLVAKLSPGEKIWLEQRILPRRRGRVRFGSLYLRVESGAGFLQRRFKVEADEETETFPDLSAAAGYGSFASRRTLLETGLRKLRLRGAGGAFESLREYASGDAFRSIDWKATARRERLIVRQYEAERSAQVIVLLDYGRLATPRVGDLRKGDYLLAAALAAAHLAQAAGDHVGLTAFAGKTLLSVAPRRGRAHLAALTKAAFDLQPRLEESDYESAFLEIDRYGRKRGLVIFFTDVFDPATSASALEGLQRLARRHVVLCVLMNDGAIAAGLADEPKTVAQAYRFGVATALADERAILLAQLRSLGIFIVDVPASQLTPALLDAYLELKARARI